MNIDKNSWAYWYDLINENEREDHSFYKGLLDKNDLALELACGTGRVYLNLIEEGYNVHGLDISDNMLKKLKENAKDRNIEPHKLFKEDISNMDLEFNYDVIYFPFNALMHINGDINYQEKVFRNIREHLKDDGIFAFDIYVIDFNVVSKYQNIKEKKFKHNNTQYKFETWSEIKSLPNQTIKTKNRVINLDKNSIEWDHDHIYTLYPKQQIELLLNKSGFSSYDIYHEFTGEKIKSDSKQMSIIAKN